MVRMSRSAGTIPTKYMSKMSIYDVNVNGFDLKVRVADHAEIIGQGISELRTQITTSIPIVGIHIHHAGNAKFPLLQLCVGNRCLVVVSCYVNPLPKCLKDFLDDPNICFVGAKMDLHNQFSYAYKHEFARGMDVRDLAARVLKNPNLLCKLFFKEVAAEVGICFDNRCDYNVLQGLSSTHRVFTNKQVECIARYPHATYLIGQKLLSLLD